MKLVVILFVILYVSGINIIISSVEKVFVVFDKFIFLNFCSIDILIIIKIGVIVLFGIKDNIGIKKRDVIKNRLVVIVVKLVFVLFVNIELFLSVEIVGFVLNKLDKKVVSELVFKMCGNFLVCFSCFICLLVSLIVLNIIIIVIVKMVF